MVPYGVISRVLDGSALPGSHPPRHPRFEPAKPHHGPAPTRREKFGLEALGQGTFQVPGGKVSLHAGGIPPLIVITTNEERELPSAFVRRCLVLHLRLPPTGDGLKAWLVARGRAHFTRLSEDLLVSAAALVVRDRVRAQELGLSPPGQAEYLDLLRAVGELGSTEAEQRSLLLQIADFALKKYPALHELTETG